MDRGVKVLHDPVHNKGTAFTEAEREQLGLRGLLPPRVHTQAEQVLRIMENLHSKATDLERYIYLIGLQDRNERLFYRVIASHIEELMPLIYTPTVGKACQHYGHLFRRSRGFYISLEDEGRIAEILNNWPHSDVRIIVVTDGERILGLGDLGTDGMGIPVGKLSLYTACAGIDPTRCLPITLDVGTNNQYLLKDPLYLGLSHQRVRGRRFDRFFREFIDAVSCKFPRAVIQLEDFANINAFRLLAEYRDQVCLFDDDIQGTGAVALAGIFSALRLTGGAFTDQRILFVGAGEAGIGIADLVTRALVGEGVDEQAARQHCWFMDSRGLVTANRQDLPVHKRAYAHAHRPIDHLGDAIDAIRPGILIGVSGQAGIFTGQIIQAMSAINQRPIIFALSNPTSKSECTASEAYGHSAGRAVFASGSPFDPVELNGRRYVPGQGNNVYVFPGVGLGLIFSAARSVPDDMFVAAAKTLADMVTDDDLAVGRIYPSLTRIREVSAAIAAAVYDVARQMNLDRSVPRDNASRDNASRDNASRDNASRGNASWDNEPIVNQIRGYMWEPDYPQYNTH